MERGIRLLLEEEYREDVKAWLLEKEKSTMPVPSAMDQQPELQWHMRAHLVDFLVEIHLHFRLRPETLYLTLSILDRYVSRRIVYKKHYQLVGCVALWIASKFEDAKERVPSVRDLKELCNGAYEEGAFTQMEFHVLGTIMWDLGHPTAESWLRVLCTETHIDDGLGSVYGQHEMPFEDTRVQHVSRFLMELTLYARDYLSFVPSVCALASLTLARYICGKGRRPSDESAETLAVISLLDSTLARGIDTISQILIKKYSYAYYSKASSLVVTFYLRGGRFPIHNSPTVEQPVSLTAFPTPMEALRPPPLYEAPTTPVRSIRRLSIWGSDGSTSTPGLTRSDSSSSMDMDMEFGSDAPGYRPGDALTDEESEDELCPVEHDRHIIREPEEVDSDASDFEFINVPHHHHRALSGSSTSSGVVNVVAPTEPMYGNGAESMPITPITPMFQLDPFGNAHAQDIPSQSSLGLYMPHQAPAHKEAKESSRKDKENVVPRGHLPSVVHHHHHHHLPTYPPCGPVNNSSDVVNVVENGLGMGEEMVQPHGEYRPALLAIVPP